ncbi:hypothetical protein K8F61_05245 [Microbacterium resistens]|uniref:DUF222 domain-containing protein n=1 Tax=Microbacterium resistens TaxID=156977 RepID=A0ABY3RWC3_9MICO|nr:hypothetical protein [Microbacterium resistens]UGS27595.1 hypothetical protein K8F61_05245 [Microbacterium resistens]
MNREQLIEKAAKAGAVAMRGVTAHVGLRDREFAAAALAVFEEAQAPTDDEREAIRQALERNLMDSVGMCICDEAYTTRGLVDPHCGWHDALGTTDDESVERVLAALRRTVQGDYYDEGTLRKVYAALVYPAGPLSMPKAQDAVNAMQNAGILFRERTVQGEPSGYRATLIREARELADHYRRYDDTETLVSTLVEMANALAAEPQGEPSDAAVAAGLDAWFRTSRQSLRESMRAALRAAAEAEGGNR